MGRGLHKLQKQKELDGFIIKTHMWKLKYIYVQVYTRFAQKITGNGYTQWAG